MKVKYFKTQNYFSAENFKYPVDFQIKEEMLRKLFKFNKSLYTFQGYYYYYYYSLM